MRTFVTVLVLASLLQLALAAASPSAANVDGPYLVLRKEIMQDRPVVGKELTIRLSVFNVGKSTAHDVSVLDDSWFEEPDLFEPIIGLKKVKWSRIAPGANVSQAIVVVPKKKAIYNSVPAAMEYSDNAGNKQLGFSNNLGQMYILTARDLDRNTTPHVREWLTFAALAFVPIGLPALYYRHLQSNYKDGMKKE